ncbi:hypothetical protein BELL_0036g00150 [Botrytis elliptica]|uniref:Uncharacterized protein n=1 Tax=Botrytis elliptica TaxID=278938 RepID=A0A4Z1K175_9HELO|nr:hypothetical protein EAE99_002835 [Botrytis elliptica]TGO79326.1 hypothetical protein BELL_0036g00150 [Botrytis elliptica]
MCDYTQVEFRCGHVRYTVRAWCINYETTHRRCPPNVVAVEFRLGESEMCGDCKHVGEMPEWYSRITKNTARIHL